MKYVIVIPCRGMNGAVSRGMMELGGCAGMTFVIIKGS